MAISPLSLEEQVRNVHDRADVIVAIRALAENYRADPSRWENQTLDAYLEALAAWIDDMDGYFRNQGVEAPDPPDWNVVAQALLAAGIYE
jgi:hypothetical protein